MITTKSRSWYRIKSLIPVSLYEPLLDVYENLRKFQYIGKNVTCPICRNSFSKFISSGKAGICPACSSGSRHRAIFLFLQRKTDFFLARLQVLHFAPEHCFYRLFKSMKNLDYLSADLGSPRAMQKIDITQIPYKNDHFDVELSSHVLEHIPDDGLAMRELYRVLKPQGWAIHLAPIDYGRQQTFEDPAILGPEQRQKMYGHHDHKRIYGMDYTERLEKAGFTVEVFEPLDFLSPSELNDFGVAIGEKIFFCKK